MALENGEFVNLVWRALATTQSGFAVAGPSFVRYQPRVLPFAAVPETGMVLPADSVLEHGTVFFSDILPQFSGGNVVETRFRVAQMIYRGQPQVATVQEDEEELSLANADEMVELTDVAFPGLFRVHTVRLGRYLGIRHEGRLVAMAGERFRFPGFREISAVCTRPGFTGRGFAARLIMRLVGDIAESAFLHVSESNTRATALYERLGFEHVRTIEVMKVGHLTT